MRMTDGDIRVVISKRVAIIIARKMDSGDIGSVNSSKVNYYKYKNLDFFSTMNFPL